MNAQKPIKGILALLGLLMQSLKEASVETVNSIRDTLVTTVSEMTALETEVDLANRRIKEHRKEMEHLRAEIEYWKKKRFYILEELDALRVSLEEQICDGCLNRRLECITAGPCSSECNYHRKAVDEEEAASGLSALFG